jgi:hypothetical protein
VLLITGQAIVDRLKEKCPSANGRVFSAADLSDVAEAAQKAPALHVILRSYEPVEVTPVGAIMWNEVWCVIAVVKHVARQDRPLAQMAEAAPLLSDAVAALTRYRYPLSEETWGTLEITSAPRPLFSDTYAYFPICVTAKVVTPRGCS